MRVREDDLVPLADRLVALQWFRLLVATATVVATAVVGVVGLPPGRVAALSLGWVAATTILEAVRRRARRRGLQLVWSLLLVDGLHLAVVVSASGGADSELIFLVHLHVVACALLASFRSGVLIAGWHAVLLVAAWDVGWADAATAVSMPQLGWAASSFLVVGAATGAFGSLNERALRSSRRAMAVLAELGTRLDACRALHEATSVGATDLRRALDARRAAVVVLRPDGWRGACDGGGSPALVHLDATAATSPDRTTRLVAAPDEGPDHVVAALLPCARNVVVLPLVADAGPIGVAAIELGAGRSTLTRRQLELAEQCAARLGLSVRNLQLLRSVEEQAATDPLTGLLNRRSFDAGLVREAARARRLGTPLAIAMIDVDHFKAVNDRHGHQAGDEVLRQLASALLGVARDETVVARYGGEEFVALLPDATIQEALISSERMRAAAEAVSAVPVTVSIGVATAVGDIDVDALLAAADAALYEAKATGRDRVVCTDAPAVTIATPPDPPRLPRPA